MITLKHNAKEVAEKLSNLGSDTAALQDAINNAGLKFDDPEIHAKIDTIVNTSALFQSNPQVVPANNLLGEAGKHRVASELLLRGFHVLFPASDEGIDLYTEEGHFISVKTARLSGGEYSFSFRRWTCRAGAKKQTYGWVHPKLTHLVLWCVDDNAFLIVPRSNTVPTSIKITARGLTGSSKLVKFVGAWDDFKDTKTLAQAGTQ
jgi:hypothetical protein